MCMGDLPFMFNRLESSMAWHDANFLCSTAISISQHIFYIQCSSVPSVRYCSSLRTSINMARGQTVNLCKGCSRIKQEDWFITVLCPTPCFLSPINGILELVEFIHLLFISSHAPRTGSPKAERDKGFWNSQVCPQTILSQIFPGHLLEWNNLSVLTSIKMTWSSITNRKATISLWTFPTA